jgi:hypothetical protein
MTRVVVAEVLVVVVVVYVAFAAVLAVCVDLAAAVVFLAFAVAANASAAFVEDCWVATSCATLARFADETARVSSPSARIATKAFIV